MTTETVTNPIEEARKSLTDLESKLSTAQSTLSEVEARFLEMVKTGGSGMEPTAQLALADERTKAANEVASNQKLVDGQKSRLDALTKTQRLSSLEKPVNAVREAARRAFESAGLAKLMSDADAGDYLHVHMHVVRETAEDGTESVKLEVSSGFQTAKTATTKPASTSTPGPRGQNRYVADGVEYETRAYVEKFAQPAIDDGTVKWTGDPLDSVGLSHRADVLAKALGHEKTKVEPTPAAASA